MGEKISKVLILTECGKSVGYGHFSRCLSIASQFLTRGQECLLVIDGEPNYFRNHDNRIKILRRPWIRDPSAVKSLVSDAKGIVIDSITIPSGTLQNIVKTNPQVAIIDDWHRRNHKNGLVIDWTVGAERFAYRKKNPQVQYLLGAKYCTIRPAFETRNRKAIKTGISRILLTFGGSDPRGMTPVVSRLLEHHHPDVIQEIVLGPGVDRKIISHFKKASPCRKIIHSRCSESKMHALMESVDLAITAGGQTLYELACVGTPSICIEVVDNQRDDIREFQKKGFLAYAGKWNHPRLNARLLSNMRNFESLSVRKNASLKGRKLVDGKGARRLVSSCLSAWRKNA